MLIQYTLFTINLPNTTFNLIFILGDIPYLLQKATQSIVETLPNDKHSIRIDLNTTQDYEQLLIEAQQPSLFTQYLLIQGASNKKTIDATTKKQLLDYLKNPNTETQILITLPHINNKLLKEFIEQPNVLVIQTMPPSAEMQKKWILASLSQHFHKILPELVESIFYSLEGNLSAIAAKINEIVLLFEPAHVISSQEIEPLLIDQTLLKYTDFIPTLLNGEHHLTLRFIRYYKQSAEEPTLLLWMITQEIRAIIQLHFALKEGQSFKNACFSLKLWSSRQQAYQAATNRLNIGQLYTLLQLVKMIDDHIKSFDTAYLWEELETLALQFCRAQ